MPARHALVALGGENRKNAGMRIHSEPMASQSRVTHDRCVINSRITKWLAGIMLLTIIHAPGGLSAQSLPGLYDVTLSWDDDPSPEVAGYIVQYGVERGKYTASVIVGNATTTTVPGLSGGITYFFAVTAYTSNGLESGFSNEVSFVPGLHTARIRRLATGDVVLTVKGLIGHTYDIEATEDFKTWTSIGTVPVGDGGSLDFIDTNAVKYSRRFYRTRDTQ